MSFLCSLEKERYGAFSNGRREKGTLLRELGVKERLAIGLGTMTGAGIFALSTVAAERVGRAAALSYLLTGMICLPVAMIISELATGTCPETTADQACAGTHRRRASRAAGITLSLSDRAG